MGSLLQLFNEWEIQLLVLLSFALQVFLFFAGNLRQRSINMLLRGTIWIAYLGADLVAIYALGFLSRHEEATNERGTLRGTHSLAFLWAPFLLIHLGGQDTITAFSMEDNSLWLRHLLNLLVQVGLALFVFWKSTSWRNVHLLVPGIFLFVAGTIKYGERTFALMQGNLNNTWFAIDVEEEKKRVLPELNRNNSYYRIVCFALRSVPRIQYLFTGCSMSQTHNKNAELLKTDGKLEKIQLPKLLDVELGIMYYDLYTKAALLRTRGGIILRCISQVSFMVALVLFATSDKQQYHSTSDVAITYILFMGGFLLEVCATLVMFMVSPWTWAWLEAQKYRRLARMSWFLLSSDIIGWPEGKPLWSNRIGQYSFLSYMGWEKPTSLSQRAMSMIRKVAKAVGVEERKMLWLSKLLDTKYEKVDKQTMDCIVKGIQEYCSSSGQQQWRCFFAWRKIGTNIREFNDLVIWFHSLTELHLSNVSAASGGISSSMDAETVALVDVCRKLSNYMLYLLLALPASMVQVFAGRPEACLENAREYVLGMADGAATKEVILRAASQQFKDERNFPQCKETLEEIRDTWVRLIMYTASKSQPEMHAALLSRGGELLTFVWLLMAHNELGDSGNYRFELTNAPATANEYLEPRYAFPLPRDNSEQDNVVSSREHAA